MAMVAEKKLTMEEAAARMQVSERQSYRIWAQYQKHGDLGLIHALRGQPSNRGYGSKIKTRIRKLYLENYRDYGATLFSEMLVSYHDLKIDHETLRRWLGSVCHIQRKKRPHRKKRERRSLIGDMVQFDGSPHDWFEGRGAPCCLLHAIDDACGQIFLRFVPSENTWDVLRTLRAYCERYGIPRSLYTDFGSVFKAERKLTDAGRAMEQLGVKMIFAHTPQAKGRVERGNRTHQDRLVKALRRENISTIAGANRYLEEVYLAEHNRQFANTQGLPDVHKSIRGYNLDTIFCLQTERQVRNDYTITIQGQWIQLLATENPMPLPGSYVTLRHYLDGSLHIIFKEHELKFKRLNEKPKAKGLPNKPKSDHPWRHNRISKNRKSQTLSEIAFP
jgi:hypothetical protein